MDPTLDRWLDAVKVALTTVVVALAFATTGDGVLVLGALVGGVVATWALSPWSRVGPHTPHAEALAGAADGDVVVYWRPGCSVALSLMARLSREQRAAATWVNVVRDHEAALFVRGLRGGDMVTPTAVDAEGALVPADVDGLGRLLARAD